jgi:hypothetical protein
MADFVIKPGAGVSNKLILKTQDNTPVLTTSDSGVTINSPTLVTPALGTVTSGNLSNTAIVYPAGHVVNQWGVHKATPGSPSFSPSATPAAIDYGSSNGGKVEVTGITATQGNILCIFASPGDIQTTNTGTYAIGTGFKIDGTNYINSSIQNANTHTYGIKFPLSLSFRHTVPSGFTNKTISAIAQKQSGGGTLQIVATATSGAYYVSMTIFEIQQ